jgi:hypothetical protein
MAGINRGLSPALEPDQVATVRRKRKEGVLSAEATLRPGFTRSQHPEPRNKGRIHEPAVVSHFLRQEKPNSTCARTIFAQNNLTGRHEIKESDPYLVFDTPRIFFLELAHASCHLILSYCPMAACAPSRQRSTHDLPFPILSTGGGHGTTSRPARAVRGRRKGSRLMPVNGEVGMPLLMRFQILLRKHTPRALRSGYVGLKVHLQRRLRAGQLRLMVDGLTALKAARWIVISPIRNDADRLPFFLQHYRSMGLQHFIFVDNMSEDNLYEVVRQQPDVTVFRAEGDFKKARFGMDWINTILSRHCAGKWCLHVDTDEFLVTPNINDADTGDTGIEGLTRRLEAHGQHALNCVMVDMYSNRPIEENLCAVGQDPLSVCPLFDATGYHRHFDPVFGMDWIKGGVRGRLFFSDILDGPALNKTPLVLWRKHYAFVHCAHQLWPPAAHGLPRRDPAAVTGALLHFKFLAQFQDKIREEAIRQQHTGEYKHYQRAEQPGFRIPCYGSTVTYRSVADLESCGLVQRGILDLPALKASHPD